MCTATAVTGMALNLPDARHQAEAVLLQNYGNLEVQAHGQGTIMIPQTTVNISAEQLKDNIVTLKIIRGITVKPM